MGVNEASSARRIDRGDLYWLPQSVHGRGVEGVEHPYVVVQDDVFNHSRIDTVVVCALSSNLRRAEEPGNVLLEVGEGNTTKRSVVISSQILSVPKSALGERLGQLSPNRVDEVLAGLRFQQRSFFAR